MKKKVLYTVLTGGYDQLIQHNYVDESYDYICFSNDFKDKQVGIWKIKPILEEKNLSNHLLSRLPKLQPHKFLESYDFSIYVDANINIKDNFIFKRVENLISKNILFAGLKHQQRECLYRESLEVLLKGFEKNIRKTTEQMKIFVKDGFPFKYGMYEANVLYRNHNSDIIKRQSDDWWKYVQNYSQRDQLSLSYTLWKNNIPFNFLLPENEWSRNSTHIDCYRHPKNQYLMMKIWTHLKEQNILPLVSPIVYPFYKRIVLGA